MEDEKQMTSDESLQLITQMIQKAKSDYKESGVSALLWGSVITICSVVSFLGNYLHEPLFDKIWWLTFLAVVFQIIFSIRQTRKRKYKTYNEDAMSGIWISFGASMFLFSYYVNTGRVDHAQTIFLVAYGIPTFATGLTKRFMPMVVGGIICWLLSIANIYTPWPYNILYSALAAQTAWFIPGLILRKRCKDVSEEHV